MVPEPDFYGILGVPRTASDSAIRSAHRRLVKSVHPDVGDDADPERFRLVQRAYETLIDPDSRARYDRVHRPRPRQRPRPTEQQGTYRRKQARRPRRGPILDWTPGECWKCNWRTGHPSLHIKMEKAGSPTHIVAIPHCDSCRTPIPKLPMATLDFAVFVMLMAAAALTAAQFLLVGLSTFSGAGIAIFLVACAGLLAGAGPLAVDIRRRIPSGYQRRANIIVKYVAEYPTVSRLFDRGYLIVT